MSREELIKDFESGSTSRRDFIRKAAVAGGAAALVLLPALRAEAGHQRTDPGTGGTGHGGKGGKGGKKKK